MKIPLLAGLGKRVDTGRAVCGWPKVLIGSTRIQLPARVQQNACSATEHWSCVVHAQLYAVLRSTMAVSLSD